MTDRGAKRPDSSGSRTLIAAWATVTLVVGFAGGWWAGSFTSCAASTCSVRVDAIEAVGTWAGGLGTIAALLFAVTAFRREEKLRSSQESERMIALLNQRAAEENEANRVHIVGSVGATRDDLITELRITVRNSADETPIFEVAGTHDALGDLRQTHRLGAGAELTTEFRNGPAVHEVPKREHEPYARKQAEKATIRFRMNGVEWERHGSAPVKRIS